MTQEEIQIRTEPRPACPVCASGGLSLYANMEDRLYGVPGRWAIRRCSSKDCGLLWLDPAPIEEDIPKTYREYFTHGPARSAGVGARLQRWLYRIYPLLAALPALPFGLCAEKRRLDNMCLCAVAPGRLLDVGCGDGRFLAQMVKQGWTGIGIEPDPAAVAVGLAAGLDVRLGDLASQGFADDHFDAITCKHVIEHVRDPVGLLSECHRILRPGGRLVVVTPNALGLGHARFTADWRDLDPPRHLQVFAMDPLQVCARRAGFSQISCSTTAAHADLIANMSMRLQAARCAQGSDHAVPRGIDPRQTLRAILFQIHEHLALRYNRNAGEEIVLVGNKENASYDRAGGAIVLPRGQTRLLM